MNLFKKKKDKICCKGPRDTKNVKNTAPKKGLFVLGSGCPKCAELENNARAAVSQAGLNIPVGHITDFSEIASYGVISTPALAMDGKVVSYGKILSVEEIKKILQENTK